jgi:hypothetical protein
VTERTTAVLDWMMLLLVVGLVSFLFVWGAGCTFHVFGKYDCPMHCTGSALKRQPTSRPTTSQPVTDHHQLPDDDQTSEEILEELMR